MTKIKLHERMNFINKNGDKEDMFEARRYNYYDDEDEFWGALFKDGSMLTLNEVALEDYFPIIDGKVINEPYELEYYND